MSLCFCFNVYVINLLIFIVIFDPLIRTNPKANYFHPETANSSSSLKGGRYIRWDRLRERPFSFCRPGKVNYKPRESRTSLMGMGSP